MRKQANLGVLLSLTLLFQLNIAWADAAPCLDAASSTIEMLHCNQQEIENLNVKLNTVYKKMEREIFEIGIAGRSPDSELRELEISERSWESAMENSCDFSGHQRGGSPMWVNVFSMECQINEIKQRINFFEVILKSPH